MFTQGKYRDFYLPGFKKNSDFDLLMIIVTTLMFSVILGSKVK